MINPNESKENATDAGIVILVGISRYDSTM